MVASLKTTKIGSLTPGLTNKREPTNLGTTLANRSKATFLYAAENVNLNGRGYKRRAGQALRVAGAAHSIWSEEGIAFVVLDGSLTQLREAGVGLERTVVRAGMPPLPVSFSLGADGDTYWTNTQVIRRVTNGVDRPIVAELMDSIPAPVLVGGALPAGRYLVALTVAGPDGESAATTPVQLAVNGDQGISFSGMAGRTVNLYATAADGEILTLQATSSTGTVSMLTSRMDGRSCQTLNRAPMPAGSIVRHYNGRMLVASGKTLYLSDPYRYGLYDPSASYVPFPADITVIEPMAGGLYIVADKTYWVGDVLSEALQEKLAYGATPRTSGKSPDGTQAFWQTSRGLVVGDAAGTVSNVQEQALSFSDASSGASLYREQDGQTHIVTSRAGVQPTTGMASSYADAEVIRQGTTK